MTKQLFDEFPYTTAKEWLARITKDLKGKSWQDLYWTPDGDLSVNPFIHAEDAPEALPVVPAFGNWRITEYFEVTDALQSNRQIQEALYGGVESLLISCHDSIQWETLLADVELPLLHIGLQIYGDIPNGLKSFFAYAWSRHKVDKIPVTISLPERSAWTFSQMDLQSAMPAHMELVSVHYSTHPVLAGTIAEALFLTIKETLTLSDWDPDYLGRCDLRIYVGMHYLVEIARLRALRILWTKLASTLRFSVSSEFAIAAQTKACTPDDDAYGHMIRSTTMALAAVLGGADRIAVAPAAGLEHPDSFYRHIARNVHHLLRYESRLTGTDDPVAGAYYIEALTQEIVHKTWEMLKHSMEESGR